MPRVLLSRRRESAIYSKNSSSDCLGWGESREFGGRSVNNPRHLRTELSAVNEDGNIGLPSTEV